jgi:small GTP-binding protein domain
VNAVWYYVQSDSDFESKSGPWEDDMGLLTSIKSSISRATSSLFAGSEPKRIGIYGPPNAGKTTLANRISRDWTGDAVGPESHVPHETRRARRKENVEIKRNGKSVTIDVVDTPGVTTKVDYNEFLEHDIDKEDAVRRSREATEGVAEAMHWLREDVDGVIYVLDAVEDPFTQVNTMLIGIIESQNLPVLIFANKIDLEDANVQQIANAFPQHETVPLSALEGDNMDEVYDKIAEYFG